MAKKSRHHRDKKKKGANSLFEDVDMMALNINGEDKPRNAKHAAKLRRKTRKQRKKREKQQKERNQFEEKQKCKSTGWHKIEVHGRQPVEKNFLYSSIGSSLELEFQPLGFHTIDKTCCFYLEASESAATAIHSLDKRLQGPDGSLLKIRAAKVRSPDLALNSDQLKVLSEVMSQRFNTATCLLDLTDLHHDATLLEKDILAPLAATYVMKQVVRVIRENIPHLKALNLSKNNLNTNSLIMLQGMHSGPSQLFALNLEHNAIADEQVFSVIKMFPLTELSLQFNPIVNNFKNKPIKYIQMAKKKLPKLKLLDTVDVDEYLTKNANPQSLPFPGSSSQFDAPSSTAEVSSSVVSELLVRSFLEQYYALVDAPDRSSLVAAYTPDAVMELKSSVQAIGSSIYVGQEKIKEALTTIPATKHQHDTFSFNIQLSNPSTAQVIVMGQCQISGLDAIVTFNRSMNIIPFNAGLCCSKDVLELR